VYIEELHFGSLCYYASSTPETEPAGAGNAVARRSPYPIGEGTELAKPLGSASKVMFMHIVLDEVSTACKIRNLCKQEHSYLVSFLLSLKIHLETNKIMDFFKFDVGNVVMVTGGRNTGRVGVIKNREKHKGNFEVIDVLLGAFCMLCLVFSYLLYRKT
jgi:hypothetical protein